MSTERCPTCGQALPKGLTRAEVENRLQRDREQAIKGEVRERLKEMEPDLMDKLMPKALRQARKEARGEDSEKVKGLERDLADERAARQREKKTVEKLQRQLSRISPHDRGLMTQKEVAQLIRAACPAEDDVSEVSGGQRGGDIVHEIRDKGKVCGKILWEVKDRADWSEDYLTKAKTDSRRVGADCVVVASSTFPKGADSIAVRQGVILVAPHLAGQMAVILRPGLVDLTEARLGREQRAAKAAKILDYIGSVECKSRFDAITDGVTELRKIQQRERNYHDEHWTKEERCFSQIATASTAIKDAVQAIARETPVKLAVKA